MILLFVRLGAVGTGRVLKWPWSQLFFDKLVELRGGVLEGRDVEIVSAEGLETAANASGEVMIRCVWHDEDTPSLSVSLSKGLFRCFGCDVQGSVYDLVAEALGVPVGAREVTDEVHTALHDWLQVRVESWHRRLVEDEELMERLNRERGILEALVRRYKIGWVPVGEVKEGREGWVTLPVMGRGGRVLNVKMHRWPREGVVGGPKAKWFLSGDGVKVWDPGMLLWPVDQLSIGAGLGRLWIVEGELDALAWLSQAVREQKDIAVVSVTAGASGWNMECTKLIEELRVHGKEGKLEIVLMFDGDDAGRKGALKAAQMLDVEGIVVYWVDWNEVREAIGAARPEIVGLRR